MALISYSKRGDWQEVIVGLNRSIIFFNPDDLQIFKEVSIPEDLKKCGLVENQPDEAVNSTTKSTPEPPLIQHVQLSPDGTLLAVTCSGQKALLLYQCRPEHAKLLSVRSLARASSAIRFSPQGKILLVTDKTGDCYVYDCEDVEKPGTLILGHLSVVYDVLLTPNEKHIITCDRDVKIRVTNYPNCYDIECFCLGHKEFVSAIKLLPTDSDVLISISGDETIKLWKYLDGVKLCEFKLPAPAIRCDVRKVSESVCHLALVLYQPNESVFVYEVSKTEADHFQIREITSHSFESIIVTDVCYAGEKLYVAGIKDEHFVLELIAPQRSVAVENVLSMVTEYFKDEKVKPEDISGWFKKNYDNVTEYYERKKRRIEEKNSKNDE